MAQSGMIYCVICKQRLVIDESETRLECPDCGKTLQTNLRFFIRHRERRAEDLRKRSPLYKFLKSGAV